MTLPSAAGFSIGLWLVYQSMVHAFWARRLRRTLYREERRLDEWLERSRLLRQGEPFALLAPGAVPELPASAAGLAHPSAVLLGHILAESGAAADDLVLEGWADAAIDARLGEPRSRIQSVQSSAPLFGVIGTIGGFLGASWVFSQTGDPRRLMGSVALALGTTLLAGVAVLIESWTVDRVLEPLEARLWRHAQLLGGRARASLRARTSRLSAQPASEAAARMRPIPLHRVPLVFACAHGCNGGAPCSD